MGAKIEAVLGRVFPNVRQGLRKVRGWSDGRRDILRRLFGIGFEDLLQLGVTRFQENVQGERIGRNAFSPGHVQVGIHLPTNLGVAPAKVLEQGVFERFKLFGREFLDGGNRDEQRHRETSFFGETVSRRD
jgi:hypothetical protein